jgi:hypothetical protein
VTIYDLWLNDAENEELTGAIFLDLSAAFDIVEHKILPEHSDLGHDILYADDDTDNVSDSNPEVLQDKLQRQADSSTIWIQDNKMRCSGEKTELLIVCTREQRAAKLKDKKLCVTVCIKVIEETNDEKLLSPRKIARKTHVIPSSYDKSSILFHLTWSKGVELIFH